MYKLLLMLMVSCAVTEFGFTIKDLQECTQGRCTKKLTEARNRVMKIDWKPISVFPNEKKRFR